MSRFKLKTEGVGETEVSLRVGRPGSYHITAAAADDAAGKRAYSAVASSKDHLLTFRFPATGHDKLEVAPASLAQAAGGRAGAPLFAFALLAFPIVALVRARRRLA